MSSNGYDKELIRHIPLKMVKDLAAVAVADYLKAIGIVERNEEVIELKFDSNDELRTISGTDLVPLFIKVRFIQDPIMEKAIKQNGTKRQKL